MPSNKVVINDNEVYEIPDSFMEPLEAYLKMVQKKTQEKKNTYGEEFIDSVVAGIADLLREESYGRTTMEGLSSPEEAAIWVEKLDTDSLVEHFDEWNEKASELDPDSIEVTEEVMPIIDDKYIPKQCVCGCKKENESN